MKNIKVFNNHFVVISEKRDFNGWHFKIYTVEGITVSYGEKYISDLKDRPTEEQCLRQYFQHKRDTLQKRLTNTSSEKLNIDKVLEQLDDFEEVVEINTVLKSLGTPKESKSNFSLGDEVYAKFWDEAGKIISVSRNTLLVEFGSKVTKLFNKKGEWLGEIPAAEATLLQLIKDTTLHKLVPIPEDVKVGDKVYDWKRGAGEVTAIQPQVNYSIVVEHSNGIYASYNRDGKSVISSNGLTEADLKLIQY